MDRGLSNKIFNSTSKPVPPLRRDIEVIPIEENGSSYLYFHDSRNYLAENFALDRKIAPLLSLLDGSKSIEDLKPWMGEGLDEEQLLEYIQFLDKQRLLHSEFFKHYAEETEESYESGEIHDPVTPGTSYPSDTAELRKQLDQAFADMGSSVKEDSLPESPVKALYAPHIDPRVGLTSYVKAFNRLRDLKPGRVVLLATSHYSSYYPDIYDNKPFVVSNKHFKMPFGTIENDREGVSRLLDYAGDAGITGRDRAHRVEHSIELHLLFLNYLWNHDYKIVPILVAGFDDLFYMEDGHLGGQVEKMGTVLRSLFGEDKDTLFLVSGDLCHVGHKFGDEHPAREMFTEIRQFDEQFLEFGENAEGQKLLDLVKEKNDPYRVCGFPPLYTFLSAFPEAKGHKLDYQLWDEKERESAVSFGSILYT